MALATRQAREGRGKGINEHGSNKEGSHFGSVGCVLSTAGGADQQHHTDFHTSCEAYEASVGDRLGTCSFSEGNDQMVTVEGPDTVMSQQHAYQGPEVLAQ